MGHGLDGGADRDAITVCKAYHAIKIYKRAYAITGRGRDKPMHGDVSDSLCFDVTGLRRASTL